MQTQQGLSMISEKEAPKKPSTSERLGLLFTSVSLYIANYGGLPSVTSLKFLTVLLTNDSFDATLKLNQITRHKLQSSIYKTNVT